MESYDFLTQDKAVINASLLDLYCRRFLSNTAIPDRFIVSPIFEIPFARLSGVGVCRFRIVTA